MDNSTTAELEEQLPIRLLVVGEYCSSPAAIDRQEFFEKDKIIDYLSVHILVGLLVSQEDSPILGALIWQVSIAFLFRFVSNQSKPYQDF